MDSEIRINIYIFARLTGCQDLISKNIYCWLMSVMWFCMWSLQKTWFDFSLPKIWKHHGRTKENKICRKLTSAFSQIGTGLPTNTLSVFKARIFLTVSRNTCVEVHSVTVVVHITFGSCKNVILCELLEDTFVLNSKVTELTNMIFVTLKLKLWWIGCQLEWSLLVRNNVPHRI